MGTITMQDLQRMQNSASGEFEQQRSAVVDAERSREGSAQAKVPECKLLLK